MNINKEIERTWRLSNLPLFPKNVIRVHLEQIYTKDGLRWRRITNSLGDIHFEVIKKKYDAGVAYEQIIKKNLTDWPENLLDIPVIRKWRWFYEISSLSFQIDHLYELGIYLLDVEIPSLDTIIDFPSWLLPVLGEEVTNNVNWSNKSLAINGIPE